MIRHMDPFIDPGPPMDALAEEKREELEEAKQREIQRRAEEYASEMDNGYHIDDIAVSIGQMSDEEIAEAVRDVVLYGKKTGVRALWQRAKETGATRRAEIEIDREASAEWEEHICAVASKYWR